MVIQAINPSTGELIREYPEMDPQTIRRLLRDSQRAFQRWGSLPLAERGHRLQTVAHVLRANATEYTQLMASEMGKPIRQGMAEIEKCAWACEFYAENAERFLRPEFIETDAVKSFVSFQPLGVILAIMPWNFPFWQVFRFAAAALMAGNTIVLKHASNVPGCALAIETVFKKAGFPEGVFKTLLVSGQRARALIKNTIIKAVTFTGSTVAGKEIAAQAGRALKKAVLELGGNDPYLILADADIDKAAATCVASRLVNTGQSCIAAKRFIVVASLAQAFEARVVQHMRAATLGDPLLEQTELGPLARKDLRDQLHQQVTQSIAKGARCLLGGEMPLGKGAFYPATVLTGVKKGTPAYSQELFGPVAAIIVVKNEAEAVRVANDSIYGLGAAVFARDTAKAEAIAVNRLQAGSCFVNALVKSDPRLPFGGIKQSGYGRELSHYGIREFVNIKTVLVR